MLVARCFLLLFLLHFINCAKILGVFPAPGRSQYILAESLMSELANRGHQVTIIASHKPNREIKNYETILVEGLFDIVNSMNLLVEKEGPVKDLIDTYNYAFLLEEYTLKHKNVQDFLHSNRTFDVVIVEQFFTEAFNGFSEYYEAPMILLSSIGPSDWSNIVMRRPMLPSIDPICTTSFTNKMTLVQRVQNMYYYLFDLYYKYFVSYPFQIELQKKYFSKPLDFYKNLYNASLMLLNSHPVTTGQYAITNNMIEIGGFYIKNKKLPTDIEIFLNNAKNGAILFSMGSNINSTNFSKDKINGLLEAFSKLEQKLLWKFETDTYHNIPKNVMISKWLPQGDILNHPNVILFITHGGLLSVTEAVYFGKPIIGIPIFGDQSMNIARAVSNGFAIMLPFPSISEKTVTDSIRTILSNQSYTTTAKRLSQLFRDNPTSKMDLAIYWIEYVLRHGDTSHLRHPSLFLYWWQLFSFDILVIILTVIFLCIFLGIKIIKNVFILTFKRKLE